MDNLTQRVQAQIALDRSRRAAGTQGVWQTRFMYRLFKAVRDNAAFLRLFVEGDGSKDWKDAELTCARVNSTEADCAAIEKWLVLLKGLAPLDDGYRTFIKQVLADWVEAREGLNA